MTLVPHPSRGHSAEPLLLGIDVGGTKILAGIVSPAGEVLSHHRKETVPDRLLADTLDLARVIVGEAGPAARRVGVGITGHVDPAKGTLLQSMNMGLANLPVASALREATGLAVQVENDVHAATIGEMHFGAGGRHQDFILFNAGTGLAAGMVFAGKLYRGASNYAGECGHISCDQSGTTLCACGLSGCSEALVLQARAHTNTAPVHLPKIEAPSRGEYAYVALNLIQLVNLLNPPVVILAGGMFTGDPQATDWVRRAVYAHALPNALRGLQALEISRLAPFTGLVGAAALTLESDVRHGPEH